MMTPPKKQSPHAGQGPIGQAKVRLSARDAARLAEQVFGVPQPGGQAAATSSPGESRAGGAAGAGSSKPHMSTDGGQG